VLASLQSRVRVCRILSATSTLEKMRIAVIFTRSYTQRCLSVVVRRVSFNVTNFDAHDKSPQVGFQPGFLGEYQGSVQPIPTFVGRVNFGKKVKNTYLYVLTNAV